MTKLEALNNNGKPFDPPRFKSFTKVQADRLLAIKGVKWRELPQEKSEPKPARKPKEAKAENE